MSNIEETAELYLLNKLFEEDRSAFELLMLEDERVLNFVRERELLIASLRDERDELSPKVEEKELPKQNIALSTIGFWTWCRSKYSYFSFACIALVGIGLASSLSTQAPGDRGIQIALPSTTHYIERTRSTGDRQMLTGSFPMTVHFDSTNLEGQTEFSLVVVEEETGSTLFTAPSVVANEEGWVSLVFNDELQGDFKIELAYILDGEQTRLPPYLISITD